MEHSTVSFSFSLVVFFFPINAANISSSLGFPSPSGETLSAQQVNDAYPRTSTGQIIGVTAHTKHKIPEALQIGLSQGNTSFTKQNNKKNHPTGSQLFTTDTALAQLLDTFLEGVGNKPNFLIFFSKIHLLMLNQLYIYLTSVYATLSVTHIDTIPDYLASQEKYALNQKTLIINHLVALIEAQLNQAILARFPAMPKNMATYAGTLLIKQDSGSNLLLLLEKSENIFLNEEAGKSLIKDERTAYLKLYGLYLSFFNAYTKTLQQASTQNIQSGATLFLEHAQRIQPLVEKEVPQLENLDLKAKINLLASLQKINPPLFFYNQSTMRGIKIIPQLAQKIPPGISSVPWPAPVVKNATNKTEAVSEFGNILGYPIAYFAAGANGEQRLFINIPTANYLYAQELLKQPEWLNSTQGIMLMTRACLGDFIALLDPLFAQEAILDPCMECITRNAAAHVGLGVHEVGSCRICQAFLKGIEEKIKEDEQAVTLPSLPGGGPTLPTLPDTMQLPAPGVEP